MVKTTSPAREVGEQEKNEDTIATREKDQVDKEDQTEKVVSLPLEVVSPPHEVSTPHEVS